MKKRSALINEVQTCLKNKEGTHLKPNRVYLALKGGKFAFLSLYILRSCEILICCVIELIGGGSHLTSLAGETAPRSPTQDL